MCEEIKGVTWDFDGRQLDYKSRLAVCYAQGFGGKGTRVITAAAVMTAESQGYTRAWHHNLGLDCETVVSIDRGLFQINDLAHPELTEEEMYDPRKNVHAAWKIYRSRGNSFSAWAAYNSGAYMKYYPIIAAVWALGTWRKRISRWE